MESIIANIAIVTAALTIVAAAALTVYSIVRSARVSKRGQRENGIPTRGITIVTVAVMLVCAIPTLMLGDVADMCITTTAVMLVIASCLVAYGRIKTLRRSIRRDKITE